MSLRNDQSPEIVALDAAVEQHRHGDDVPVPDHETLKAFAATLSPGTPVSVVRLSARTPWIEDLAALYCFNASRWDTPADVVYCLPNNQPPGGWEGSVVYVDFIPPANEIYTIVVSIGGPNAVAHLRGPWGVIDRTVPDGQDSDTIGVTCSGSGPLWFTITFSGTWLGLVSAVQIFEMT